MKTTFNILIILCINNLFFFLMIPLIGCTDKSKEEQPERYQFQHPSMGSLFQVTVYASDSSAIAKVASQAFEQLDSLNLVMSDYLPHSELMRLSQSSGTGQYVKVSAELGNILGLSKYWYDWSDGIFDVTVGPYTQLWRRAKRQGIPPTNESIIEAGSSVGFDLVTMDVEKGVMLVGNKMQLDLGGIAKGYAVDRIYDHLVKHGYPKCLVDGGGDLRLGDSPPLKTGWEVTIENYLGSDTTLVLSNIAVATSGDFFRSLEIDGKKYSHIIDPFTGYGITVSRAVTAIARDCATADVLASVFSIAGPDNGRLNSNLPPESNVLIYEKEEDRVLIYDISSQKKPPGKNL